MRCDQCKHWGDYDDDYEFFVEGNTFRDCQSIKDRDVLEVESNYDLSLNTLRHEKAFIGDPGGLGSCLRVGPNFGCVKFEQR